MTEEIQTSSPVQHHGILNQTLGDILHSNKQAQNLIMHAMGITPEKFQEMLTSTEKNPMMQQTIGELFKNGTMQKAAQQSGQVPPQQMQQIVNTLQTQQSQGEILQTPAQTVQTNPQTKPSFFQKIKKLFG